MTYFVYFLSFVLLTVAVYLLAGAYRIYVRAWHIRYGAYVSGRQPWWVRLYYWLCTYYEVHTSKGTMVTYSLFGDNLCLHYIVEDSSDLRLPN